MKSKKVKEGRKCFFPKPKKKKGTKKMLCKVDSLTAAADIFKKVLAR